MAEQELREAQARAESAILGARQATSLLKVSLLLPADHRHLGTLKHFNLSLYDHRRLGNLTYHASSCC